jgi:hypothetical protein
MNTEKVSSNSHAASHQATKSAEENTVEPSPEQPPGEAVNVDGAQPRTPDTQKPGKLPTLSEYNNNAKYSSTIVRQLVFSESRFNNSKLVMDSVLRKIQVKGGWMPPGIRVGTLGLTRLNSGITNFSKAGMLIDSAQQKLKAGKDATDDIISATALMGEGFTEIFAGLGADVGNYLVKQWQLELGKTGSIVGTPATSVASSGSRQESFHESGSGTPIPASSVKTDVDAALAGTPPMSPHEHEAAMASSEHIYFEKLDNQLHDMRDQLKRHVMEELDKVPDGSKPARLAELSDEAYGKIELAEQLVSATKRDISATKTQRESDFRQLDQEMKPVRDQLKSGKYIDADVAGLSPSDAAQRLGAKLLSYRCREEALAQSFEMATEDVPVTVETLAGQVEAIRNAGTLAHASREQTLGKLQEWKNDYRKTFLKYQKAISAPTENLPEWLKISPALKSQLGPAALNTAFSAADFGAKLDDYMKKVADGTLTSDDKFNLAASSLGLIGGMSSFIPVFGPLISIGLSIVGFVLSDLPEQLREGRRRDEINVLRDEVVDEYLKTHPESGNYVYRSDVGAGA